MHKNFWIMHLGLLIFLHRSKRRASAALPPRRRRRGWSRVAPRDVAPPNQSCSVSLASRVSPVNLSLVQSGTPNNPQQSRSQRRARGRRRDSRFHGFPWPRERVNHPRPTQVPSGVARDHRRSAFHGARLPSGRHVNIPPRVPSPVRVMACKWRPTIAVATSFSSAGIYRRIDPQR